MNFDEFVDRVTSASAAAAGAAAEMYETWAEEAPPDSVLLGAMGRQLVAELMVLSAAQRAVVFEAVEEALGSGDETLATVVATGFLEGLENQAVRSGVGAATVRQMVGPQALAYLVAWEEFNGRQK